ncbi:MAG TPA: DegT/DnrJ/EryC1/StrS family aminotransferase, partial [Chthoniobacter sp.]|nr:DegT/DnrJ/EryC1/StrS family aminotransferase [Chthoniobacter sp.]
MALSNLAGYERLSLHNLRLQKAYRAGTGDRLEAAWTDLGDSADTHHYAVLDLKSSSGSSRDLLLDVLFRENVFARRYFWPGCHRSAPYSDAPHPPLHVTERLAGSLLQVPTGVQLSEPDAKAIGECLAFCLAHARQIEEKIREATESR